MDPKRDFVGSFLFPPMDIINSISKSVTYDITTDSHGLGRPRQPALSTTKILTDMTDWSRDLCISMALAWVFLFCVY
jgi:hypothetical protein